MTDDGHGALQDRRGARLERAAGATGGYGYTARIPLTELAPGLYVLNVEARSRLGDHVSASAPGAGPRSRRCGAHAMRAAAPRLLLVAAAAGSQRRCACSIKGDQSVDRREARSIVRIDRRVDRALAAAFADRPQPPSISRARWSSACSSAAGRRPASASRSCGDARRAATLVVRYRETRRRPGRHHRAGAHVARTTWWPSRRARATCGSSRSTSSR